MNRYDAMDTPVTQEFAEQTERDRSHLFRLSSGVGLPLAQSSVTGFVVAGAVGVYCWLLGAPGAWWKYSLGTLVGVLVIAWLVLLWRWLKLTTPLERLLNIDLNKDGVVGEPEPVQVLRVELKSEDGKQLRFLDLPYAERLPDFFRSLETGSSLSESTWCGSGAAFSKPEFFRLRDELLKTGIIRWRNPDAPAQGLDLTPSGKAVARYIAHPPSKSA